MNLVEKALQEGRERAEKVAENVVQAYVRSAVLEALNHDGGSVQSAAKRLGITSKELVALIKEHDLVATWKQRTVTDAERG